jgi:hypothetical protein
LFFQLKQQSIPPDRQGCLFVLLEVVVRKTLIALGAVAALAGSAGGALADPTVITFDGACNSLSLTTNGNSVTALLSAQPTQTCEAGFGTGFNGKVKRFGNGTGLAVTFTGDAASYYLALSTPYITGGTWRLYTTPDGAATTFTSGTYSVVGTAEVHPRGTKSITSFLRKAP